MKSHRLLFLAAGLLLVGAGCVAPAPTAVAPAQPIDTTTPAAPPPETAPSDASASQTEPPAAMQKTWAFPGVLPENQISNREIRIKTDKGDIVFALYDKDAPKTVSNFVYLAKGGFYDGLTFHRREDWVLQGGDPTGTGAGGPGYQFEDEPVTRQYVRGIVAMANAGPNTNGSQFFILLKDTPLDPAYTIFGQVISGMDVVDKMKIGDVMRSVMVEAKSR